MASNDVKHMIALGLESNISTFVDDKIFYYSRGLQEFDGTSPILVLIHGYPQTNFMWRHIVPLLPLEIPLFIPDIPGYGRSSSLTTPHDKLSVGTAILHTLSSLLPVSSSPAPLILCGHDRGARIVHRLGVSKTNFSSTVTIRSLILLDILPTLTVYRSFSAPSTSTNAFHWPLLANVSLGTQIILSLGPSIWVQTLISRWIGLSGPNIAQFHADNSIEIYTSMFNKEETVRATCDDYRAGAEEDVSLQEEDQKLGRKLDLDVLVVHSERYLGRREKVENIWTEWMGSGKLIVRSVGEGCGHFVAEEGPEMVAKEIVNFYQRRL